MIFTLPGLSVVYDTMEGKALAEVPQGGERRRGGLSEKAYATLKAAERDRLGGTEIDSET